MEPIESGARAIPEVQGADGEGVANSLLSGTRQRLDPRAVRLMRLGEWGGTAVLAVLGAAGVGSIFLFTDWPEWIRWPGLAGVGLLVLARCFWSHFWPPIQWRHVSYRVDELGMEIRRGVVFRHVQMIPRSRIQHTDVSQGPLQRRYGLSTLTLHTAGTLHSSVELGGITRETAEAIRDFLVGDSGSDDAV